MSTAVTSRNSLAKEPLSNHCSSFCEKLLLNLQTKQNTQSEDLVSMFAELESEDADIANNATQTLEFLLNPEKDLAQKEKSSSSEPKIKTSDHGFTLHALVLKSLPVWPIDASAIQKTILKQSESNNPIVKERARIACSYLVTHRYKEGFATANSIASKKLQSSDEKIQQEGFAYFAMLLNFLEPNLPEEALLMAINIASKMFTSESAEVWVSAHTFFEQLIKNGKDDDVLKIKDAILSACASNHYHMAFKLCDEIVTRHANRKDLIAIPVQAAINACESKNSSIRDEAFFLFWRLLNWAPKESVDTVIHGILMESKQKDPCIGILGRLKELAGHDFSNLFYRSKQVIEQRWRKDSAPLLEALTNLSSSKASYISEEAMKLKIIVEDRLNPSQK